MVSCRDDGQTKNTETHYFIGSCSLDIERVANAMRRHRSIENSLHWVLDVSFREDESRIRRGYSAEVMSMFRRMTLNLLKQNTTSKVNLKRKRKIARRYG